MTLKFVLILFLAINGAAYFSMMMDKWFAIKNKWRLSEAYLLSFALFGGGLGLMMGMISFRHKLSKLRFRVVSTIGIAVLLVIMTYFIWRGNLVFYK